MKRNALIVAALAVGLVGCKKDEAKTAQTAPTAPTNAPAPLPPDLTRTAAVVDPSKLVAPSLFANVPADTPYLVGSFEPIPLAYIEKIFTKVGPAIRSSVDSLRDQTVDPASDKAALLDAIMTELDGKWNAAGLETLGLSSQPRFAVYGLGVAPAVMRLEVKDDKAVLATVQRIATRAGVTLRAQETRDGKSFWRFVETKTTFIVALTDNQLVLAAGPSERVDATLPLILGIEKPAQSMADGKALARVMTDFGYGPYIVGFVDSRRFVDQLVGLMNEDKAEDKPSDACVAELRRMAGRAPRLAFGYHELSLTKQTMSFVAELAPDLLAQVAALRTEVPGLSAALANQPLMAMGGGIDFVAGQQLLIGAMASWNKVYTTCEMGKKKGKVDLSDAMASVSRPLPAALAKITGGVLSIQDLAFAAGNPLPSKAEGFLLVTSTDAKGLYDLALQKNPSFARLGITVDGKLHEIPHDKLPIPFAVHVGVGPHALGAAIGDKGKVLGEQVMGVQGGGKAPFLAMTYDYPRLIEMTTQVKRLQGNPDPTAALNLALADLFRRGSVTFDTSDKGLVMWASVEMK